MTSSLLRDVIVGVVAFILCDIVGMPIIDRDVIFGYDVKVCDVVVIGVTSSL